MHKSAKWIVVLVALLLLPVVCMPSLAEANGGNNLALDLVIVIDQSSSMGYIDVSTGQPHKDGSDPRGYRLDAASIMLGMCDVQDSRAALVLFNKNIETKRAYTNKFFDISMLSGSGTREKMVQMLSKLNRENAVASDTDIGLALKRAVQIISDDPSERQPVILLLTDGDFATTAPRTVAQSIAEFDEAAVEAVQRGIKVYTIALSSGKVYDTTRLSDLAQASGGLFRSVSSVVDLPEIFNDFFAHEIGSDVVSLKGQAVALENGQMGVNIVIPNKSVSEANIMIASSHLSNIQLYQPGVADPVQPDGRTIVNINTNYFSLYKIVKPQLTGDWRMLYTSDQTRYNDANINVVFSYNLGTQVSITPDAPHAKTDEITVTAKFIAADGKPATDENLYLKRPNAEGIVASISILSEDGKVAYQTGIKMDKFSDRFEKKLALGTIADALLHSGQYQLVVHFEGDGMKTDSASQPLTIENQLPKLVANTDRFEDIVIHDPLGDDYANEATGTVDIATLVTEPEGEALQYALQPIEGEDVTEASLNGSVLALTTKGQSGAQKVIVRAADPEGAYVDVPIQVGVTSIRDQLANTCKFSIKPVEDPGKDTDVTLQASLEQNETPLMQPELLELLKVDCTIRTTYTDANGEKHDESEPLVFTVDTATGVFTANIHTNAAEAVYEVTGAVLLRDINIPFVDLQFTVGNIPPMVDEEYAAALQGEYAIEPFLWASKNEPSASVDLHKLFLDSKGDTLTFAAYAVPEDVHRQTPAKTADEWLQNAATLVAADWCTIADDGTLNLDNTKAGNRHLLLTASDVDGAQATYLYAMRITSQKSQVITLIALVVAVILVLVALFELWYWLVYRKSWTVRHGAVSARVNGTPKPTRFSFPLRGRSDAKLAYLHINDAGQGPALAELQTLGDSFVLRAMQNGNVQLRRVKPNKTSFGIMVGASTMGEGTSSMVWQPGEKLTLKSDTLHLTLELMRELNAGNDYAAARRAVQTPTPANRGSQDARPRL